MTREYRNWSLTVAFLLFFLSGLVGCGGGEDEVPPAVDEGAAPGAAPAPGEPAGKAAPAGLGEAYLPDAPVAIEVLGLRPDSAVFSMAIPSIAAIYDISTTLVTRYAPPDQVGAVVNKWVSEVATEFGVPDAQSPMDIARLRGFDPDAPVAVFAEFERLATAFEEAVDKATAAPAPAPAPDAGAPESAAPEPAEPAEPGAPEFNEEAFGEAIGEAFEKQPPAVVVAWKALDVAAAENSLKELYTEYFLEAGETAEEEAVPAGAVTIHSYGNGRYAYAIVDDRVFAGTSAPMIQECLARVGSPAPVRYGTASLPSLRRDEVVSLIDVAGMMDQMRRMLPAVSRLPGSQGVAGQERLLERWGKYYAGESPMVSTLAVIPAEDSKPPMAILRTLAERSQFPGMEDIMGGLPPMRLTPLMPENTQLLIAQVFTPLMKEMTLEQWTAGIPPEAAAEPMMAQTLAMLDKTFELIRDEFVLGVLPTQTGLPGVLLMVGLTDAEKARTELLSSVPTTPGEMYKEVQILTVAYPIPMATISMAYVGNDLVVATDLAVLRTAIDRLKGDVPPALFASLDPPLDAAVPRQVLLLIQSQLLIDVVVPLSAFAGGLGKAQGVVDAVTDTVRELRVTSEVRDLAYESQAVVYLK